MNKHKLKDSGIEWIGEIPEDWGINRTKHFFTHHKDIVGENSNLFDRLALTLKGVIKRSKDDSKGLQPEAFNSYQILRKNDLVFKLIDLENVSTSRVGLCPFIEGIVSPAYIILTPNDKIYPKYGEYYYLSMWHREIFNHLGDDGVRSSLNVNDLLNIPILIINKEEQQKIAEFLDEKCSHIDSVLDKTKVSIEEYKKLKQAVITQAVTKGIRPNRPMKDSGITWIGKIPEDWRTVKLKYLSIEIGDGLHSTPNYDTEGNIYFINGNNIGAEALVFKSDTSRINEIEFAKYKQPIMNENTILITLNGATYGKTSYYNNEKILLGKSAGYITLKCKESKQFLRYYLQSTIAKTIMDLSLNGTTIANLSLTTLNNFLIIYPSIVEQQEIVSYLNAKCAEIDKLIEKKEQLISELETYKKSLIYEYVTGKKEVC